MVGGALRQEICVRGPKTDPPLTRRALSDSGWFRKLLSELVELTGIEPVTS